MRRFLLFAKNIFLCIINTDKRATAGRQNGSAGKPPQKGKTMWTADAWKDYEVIDTSGGEKLERWGDYILVRPDPQVIWNTPRTDRRWKQKNGHYHRSSKGGGEWEFFQLPEEWCIRYREL